MLSYSVSAIGISPYMIAEASVKAPTLKVDKKTLYAGYNTYAVELKNVSSSAKIAYKSINSKIASVSSKGVINPITKGTTKVIATVNQNSKSYILKLTIIVSNPSITILDSTKQLTVGDIFAFKAKVEGSKDKIIWSVSNSSLASIASNGKLTALQSGTVTVYAKAGSITDKYTVKIEKPVKVALTSTEIYNKCVPCTVDITVETDYGYSYGSGFFIGDSKVVTNYHVIEGASRIKLTTSDKKEFEIKRILGYDPTLDIAILELDLEHASLDICTEVSGGEEIYTIGSPLGLNNTMTKGMVSTASRVLDKVEYIQIDAPISHGNSGGPLVNVYGEVLGINTMGYTDGQNLNFAVSIKELQKVDTSKPVTISEFHKLYDQITQIALSLNLVKEDTVKSQSPKTSQTLYPDYGLIGCASVSGTIKSSEYMDCYYFETKEACYLYGLLQVSNAEELEKTYFELYTYSGERVCESYLNKTEFNETMLQELDANTAYVIVVYLPDGYVGADVNYLFGIYLG